MARNGSGTYSLPAGNPFVTGTTISSTTMNSTLLDIASALTQSLSSDGQTTPTANIPMGNYKLTTLGNGTATTDAANVGQIQSSAVQWLTSVSGVDTITAGISPTPAAYAAGQTFRFVSAGANTGAVTLNISSLGAKSVVKNGHAPLSAGDIGASNIVTVTYDGTNFVLISPSLADNSIQDFRLTLTTGAPVTTSDVTGATTIYCTPYKGNRIALYDGTRWNLRTSAEFSGALGTLAVTFPYDVFCYDNAGTPTLELTAWTSNTARATALVYQDGVLVKSGAATRRYLGTFKPTSTTQTEDSAANRYLWNYYHRIKRRMRRVDSTASWTYSSGTIRQANGSTSNQLNFVIGVAEDTVTATVSAATSNTSLSGLPVVYIGLDTTTGGSSVVTAFTQIQVVGLVVQEQGFYSDVVPAGYHYLSWNEANTGAAGTATWYGTTGNQVSGIIGEIFA